MRIDSVPCVVRTRDGSPCGRRILLKDVKPGEPAVCSVHRNVALGNPNNGGQPLARKQQTPEQVLDDLMHSKEESIRLRAADAFLKRQERQTLCPTCSKDRDQSARLQRLTDEQRCQLRELITKVHEILEPPPAETTAPTPVTETTAPIEPAMPTNLPDLEEGEEEL